MGLDSAGAAVPGMYLNAAGNEIEVPFIRRLAEFGSVDQKIQDRLLEVLLVLKELFRMDLIGMLIIHMVSQIECNTVEHTMLPIWHMLSNAIAGPTGAPVCLDPTAQARNCVPINLFGIDAASEEAVAYVKATTSRQQ